MISITEMIDRTLEFLRIDIEPERRELLSSYVGELERWNKRINLTGLIRTEEIVRDLIADGLYLHTVIPPGGVVLDLGSGAGILAIPLAVLDPSRAVRSIDKSLRKIQFQRHVKRSLGLSNLEVFHNRAEDLPSVDADILVAKAFGSIPAILGLGRSHLVDSGSAFLQRGSRETVAEGTDGFLLAEIRRYHLPRSSKDYQLFVYKKVTRPGVLC
jgi:16S rRNA (guanine527-N7)-methyltransferase